MWRDTEYMCVIIMPIYRHILTDNTGDYKDCCVWALGQTRAFLLIATVFIQQESLEYNICGVFPQHC